MPRFLGVFWIVVLFASAAFGQAAGTIYFVSDPQTYDCSIHDTAPGIVKIHMILDLPNGEAVQFGAPKPDCWTGATYLGESIEPDFLLMGKTYADIGLVLFVLGMKCPDLFLQSPIYIGFVSYTTTGEAPTCCEYPVTKVKDTFDYIPGPVGVVCDDNPPYYIHIALMEGKSAFINPDASCPCSSTIAHSEEPKQNNTWGEIKSLYQ